LNSGYYGLQAKLFSYGRAKSERRCVMCDMRDEILVDKGCFSPHPTSMREKYLGFRVWDFEFDAKQV